MKRKRKKRSVTLIEIMIVIMLIGLISGALAFNMRGSMDKGKIFKTEQNKERLYDILMLEHAETGKTLAKVVEKRQEIAQKSPLVKGGGKLLKDAWGDKFKVIVQNDDILITSQKLDDWNKAHATQ